MAFDSTYFGTGNGGAPGFRTYRYHTTDQMDVVEDAGYLNNKDDNLNLRMGDTVEGFTWSATPFSSGATITEAKVFVVTNVIDNDAASSAGNVNLAEIWIGSSISSGG